MPTPQDNLRVKKPIIVGYKMSPQQLVGYYISQRKVDRIYDADKAKMYRDKQNMYNSTLFGSPRIVDMSVQTVPEWLALGYTLKKGGKLIPKHQNGDRVLYTGVKEFADKVHVNDDGTVTTPSGTTGNVVLPTITVKPYRSNWYLAGKHDTSPYWDSAALSPIIDFVPGIGDVKGVNDIYDDFSHHRYAAGTIALGAMFLPNIIEKPLRHAKSLVRRGKKWINAPKRIDKAIDRITQIRDDTKKQYQHFRGESQGVSNIFNQLSPQEREDLQDKAKDLYKKSTGKVYNAKRDILNKSVENYKQVVKENSNLLTLDKIPKDKRELYIQLSNEDPSYIEFTKQNNLPFDKQSTVDKWIEKQRTGIRGVYSDQPNAREDILEPMFTETKEYNPGGDSLGSEGGVYVSNSMDIANRFSRSLSSEPGTAAYAIVKAPDIDRSVSIPQQLSQLRRRIFPYDLIDTGLKFSNKDLLDLGYIGKQRQYTTGEGKLLPAYETAYFSDKPKTKVLEVSDFKTSNQTKNIAGRWGAGAGGASLTDNLYSPYKPSKSKGDLIHFYRTLNRAKIPDDLIKVLEYRNLQPYRERIILNTPKAPSEYLEPLNSRLYNQTRNINVLTAKKNHIQNARINLKNNLKKVGKGTIGIASILTPAILYSNYDTDRVNNTKDFINHYYDDPQRIQETYNQSKRYLTPEEDKVYQDYFNNMKYNKMK